MSWQPCDDPQPGDRKACDLIDVGDRAARPRSRRLRGSPRAALAERQMVGPFIFFDQMGPAEFLLGQGIDVRPHPAYRALHRDLSVRRRGHAPRLPRHRAGDPARRAQLDDRRPRHRSFRAHRNGRCAAPVPSCSASRAGSRCRRKRRGDGAGFRALRGAARCRCSTAEGRRSASSPGRCSAPPRRSGPRARCSMPMWPWPWAPPSRSTPIMKSARSTPSPATIDIAGDVFGPGQSAGVPARRPHHHPRPRRRPLPDARWRADGWTAS